MKYFLIIIFLPCLIFGDDSNISYEEPPRKGEFYSCIGTMTFIELAMKNTVGLKEHFMPQISIGYRKPIKKRGKWDTSIGAQGGEYFQIYFWQNSYLYYPFSEKKFYLGLGFLVGEQHITYPRSYMIQDHIFWYIPITMGMDFENTFIQIRSSTRAFINLDVGFKF